jgi:hypothetical protein
MRFKLYAFIFFVIIFSALSAPSYSQGCVAVKNMGSCPLHYDSTFQKGMQISLNYRYFRSYKHFVGREEQTERVEQGTEVINNDNSVNIALAYTINRRWSASLIIPYIWIDRSSMYEHLGNSYPGQNPPNLNNPNYERFHTQSRGIGDIRVLGYYNAIPANKTLAFNIGFGFKLPTGDYDATDYFHKKEGLQEGVVDQSIQPGDGGFGTILDLELNLNPMGKFGGYVNGMYMANPRNTNGVKRSSTLTKTASGEEIPLSNEFSVVDQYLLRAGGRFSTEKLQLFLGGRMECIPSKDLIGDSDGFRRPGYIISVEPSAFYTFGKHTVGVNFPIALERNRTRSQIDIARGTNPTTGEPYHGDAAFADWLLSVTYAFRISM